MYDSLQPHGLQHARLPSPSLSPGVCTNSCPLNQWFHSIISSSVTRFSSCPQSFPASRSFTMSWPFISGGQGIGASASVLPINIQGWFSSELTGLISLLFKGLSRLFSSTTHHNISLDVQCWCCCSCLGPIPLLPLHPCIHSKQLIFFNSNFCIALSQNLNVSEAYKSISYQTHCKYGLEKSETHTQESFTCLSPTEAKKKKFY